MYATDVTVRRCIEREREGGGERERERERERCDCATDVLMYMYAGFKRKICVIIFVTPSPLPLHVFYKALRAFKDRSLKITILIIIVNVLSGSAAVTSQLRCPMSLLTCRYTSLQRFRILGIVLTHVLLIFYVVLNARYAFFES